MKIVLICFVASLVSVLESSAQCTGNVLFLENFGGTIVAPFTGSRLPPGTTSYTFDSLGTIQDGEYGIRRSSADVVTGGPIYQSWHVGFDHSGGHMMIVNADFTAGKFYETRVNNLCSGSRLYFSAWIANLLRAGTSDPLDPIVRFEIASAVSGNVLATYTTPAIPRFTSFTWTRYGFNFSLPAGENNVILRIFNNQPGGQGNDLCLDDIEFTLCGPAMNPAVSGTYQNTDEVCSGNAVVFEGNVATGFYQNPAYQWQFSTDGTSWTNIAGAQTTSYTISSAQVNNTGFYRLLTAEAVNINSANCRAVSPVKQLRVFNTVPATISGRNQLCVNDTLRLSTNVNAISYSWSANAGVISTQSDIIIPNVSQADAGTYALQMITNGGCTSASSTIVSVQANNLTKQIPQNELLCDGADLPINAAVAPATQFLWNDGSLSPQRLLRNAGTYILQSSDGVCRRLDTLVIATKNTPSLPFIADTSICFSDSVVLNVTTTEADSYLWSNGTTTPSISVTAEGLYTVQASNACGSDEQDVFVRLIECSDEVFVPNAFTPDGNGLNDVLKARAFFRIDSFELRIYNRWGQELFQTKNIFQGWDGTYKGNRAEAGQYIWKMFYKRNNTIINRKGTLLLLR